MAVFVTRLDRPHLIDNIHPFQNSSKDAVTETIRLFTGMIQKSIVNRINEKLAGSRINHGGTGHSQCSARVLKTIGRLVLDSKLGLFRFHIFIHTATLNHEILDYALKYQPVVMTFFYV